jgi:hypothetical protein
MIVEYDEAGRVSHMIFDPVPREVEIFYGQKDGVLLVPDLGMTERASPLTHYVLDHALIERPKFDVAAPMQTLAADGEDAFVLQLPDPCDVFVDGQPVTITGGELVLTSIMPATYRIDLVQWPYQAATIEVTFDAA